MRTSPLALAALLAACLLLAAASASAQESGDRVGDVVWTEGRVTGQPAGGAVAALADGDEVVLDMRVRTGPDSGAAFTFDPRGSLQLGAETDVALDRSTLDAAGVSEGAISVFLGYVRASLSSLFRGSFEVDTPAATIGVKGTVFGVRVVEDDTTTVWAFEAFGDDLTVTSKATGGSVVLQSGQVTVVAPGQSPTQPIPFDPKTGAAGNLVLPLPPDVPLGDPTPPRNDNEFPGVNDPGLFDGQPRDPGDG